MTLRVVVAGRVCKVKVEGRESMSTGSFVLIQPQLTNCRIAQDHETDLATEYLLVTCEKGVTIFCALSL